MALEEAFAAALILGTVFLLVKAVDCCFATDGKVTKPSHATQARGHSQEGHYMV